LKLQELVKAVIEEASRVLVDRGEETTLAVLTIVAGGHGLIEGVPGIAKTLLAKTVAKVLNLKFSRIQCTPDLLPADVLGTKVYNQKTGDFELRVGPIYANLVLVDEINRASPRTQSALLEAMQERQVTIEGETIKLPEPFTVLATQNPVELEGTFPLPEAQIDRFYIKINMELPSSSSLIKLLKRGIEVIEKEFEALKPVASSEDVMSARRELESVFVDDSIYEYIARIVEYSHKHPAVRLGISPRGALMLLRLAKEFALLDGRRFVIPDDVKRAAVPALSHRILIKPEYVIEGYSGQSIVKEIIENVEVPKP